MSVIHSKFEQAPVPSRALACFIHASTLSLLQKRYSCDQKFWGSCASFIPRPIGSIRAISTGSRQPVTTQLALSRSVHLIKSVKDWPGHITCKADLLVYWLYGWLLLLKHWDAFLGLKQADVSWLEAPRCLYLILRLLRPFPILLWYVQPPLIVFSLSLFA